MAVLYPVLLIILLIVGLPVAIGIGGTSLLLSFLERGTNFSFAFFAQRSAGGLNSFLLLAVPLFLYSGKVMNTGNITNQIFSFAKSMVGSFHGGLGHVNIVSSVIFAGMTGTATSDAAGLGAVELKAMKEAGYDDGFSVAVTAASSTLGPIIPPSLALVLYGLATEVSIGALLVGGIVPGLLMAIAMMIYVEIYARRKGMPKEGKFSITVVAREFGKSFWALLTPAIIIGGILTGVFPPTEAAAVASLYATVLTFIRREMNLRQLWQVIRETVEDSGIILLIVSMSQVYGYLIARSNITVRLAEWVGTISTDPIVVGLLLIAFLLLVGCFMDAAPAITILAPAFLPIFATASIDPLHFGLIMVLTLMIGLLTPPFGMVLFIMKRLSGLPMGTIIKNVLPFIIPLLLVDILLLIFPKLVTWLPSLL